MSLSVSQSVSWCQIEIFVRFETQEDTGKHLQELQNRAEKEIRDLGSVKEKLEAEWELVKFMGQEENTELREKLELLDEDIQDQQVGGFHLYLSSNTHINICRSEREMLTRSSNFSTNCWLASSPAWRRSPTSCTLGT